MNRRQFLKTAGATVAGLPVVANHCMAADGAAAPGPATTRSGSGAVRGPNVLFIACDDLRTSLGCYGDSAAITPNIDALAGRGTLFKRAYCQQSVCNPSRQSLLTGRRPDTLRIWDLKTHFRDTTPGAVSLPEHFKNSGYFAQSIGKIYHDAPITDPQSWSVPQELKEVPKREDYQLAQNRNANTGKVGKAAAREFVDAPEDAYADGRVASAAISALEKFAGDPGRAPFFLGVGFRKPHLPFSAPKKYWDLHDAARIPPPARGEAPRGAPAIALHDSVELRGYTDVPAKGEIPVADVAALRRGYYAAASYMDAQLGRVMAALGRTGLDRGTIIVFWADHGWHLGEHGLWCKTTNYEADTRVPLIIARPGAQGGRVTTALTELLDVYPTLVDLCGLERPAGLEGQSLRPWLDDPEHQSRAAAFSQFPRPWFYHAQPEVMGYAVRTDTHRYVEWRRHGTPEVVARELYAYTGVSDLFESDNLAGDAAQAGLIDSLRGLLPKATGAPRTG